MPHGMNTSHIFVNRDGPKAEFAKAVEAIATEKTSLQVFHGIGGQGKSALCRALYGDKDAKYGHLKRAMIDLRNQWSVDAVVLLVRIRNSFAKDGLSFASFDLALSLYWATARNEQPLPQLENGWIGRANGAMGELAPNMVQPTGEALMEMVESIPVFGIMATRMGGWVMKRGQKALLNQTRSETMERLFQGSELKQPHELEELLPWFLAQDLAYHHKNNNGNRYVLFVDEYEGLFTQNTRWQENPFDRYMRSLIESGTALLVVIFSREKLPWGQQKRWQKILKGCHHELKGLDESYADDWLQQIPIEGADIRAAMIEGARENKEAGSPILPFLLELQIGYGAQLKEKGETLTSELFVVEDDYYNERCHKLVDRLMRSFDDPLCHTLERLCVVTRFDKEAYEAVIPKTGMAPDDFTKLVSLSFIKQGEDGFFSLHRAMADAIYETLAEERQEDAITHLLTHFTDRVTGTAIKDVTSMTVIALMEASALYLKSGFDGYVAWLSVTNDNIARSASFAQIESLLRDALALSMEIRGELHEETAICHNEIGFNLTAQGRYEEAAPYFEEGLEIRQQVLGEVHPETAASYNNVGSNLNAQGRHKEATPYYEKGLEIFQQVLGVAHPYTATSYNNVGYNLTAQDRDEEAAPYYKKGLEIRQQVLGEAHASTATSYNNVGYNLFHRDQLEEAEPYHRKAYEIGRATLGDEHPFTKSWLKNWKNVKSQLMRGPQE